MESGQWLAVMVLVAAVSLPAKSDPQINLLNKGCSQYNATNIKNFFGNLNGTFADMRAQLSSGGGGKRFATAQQSRSSDPVYGMAQCRNYLSVNDCLVCYDAAVAEIRNCSASNGARVIYDGCFLRYESNSFYDQTTLPGNSQLCSNLTASQPAAFSSTGLTFLQDLVTAAPRISGYFAATKTAVSGGGNSTIHGVVQCAETVTPTGCRDCLTVAYRNVQSCLPDAGGRAFDAGCFLRYSDRPFFSDNQTMDIAPYLQEEGNSSKKKAIIGGVVGGAALLLILIAFFLWYKFSRKPKAAERGDILGATELQGPKVYSYKDLKAATNNFSEENKLGEGGFGDVYKAALKNGATVAVKRLDISYNKAKTNFEMEVRLLSNVHHRNLVRLLGCSSKGLQLLLVYEYMANGSLDRFLYGDKRGALTWKQRFDIIFGTARGLAYLHEQYHVCIIHRDIKPSNILLDDEFQAKIADFGLVRLLPENQSHVSTRFAGTLGYTAPEYAIHGHLSEKVDTYSFGVVILENISGRRASDRNTEADTEYLLEEAWKLYEIGMHQRLADEALDSNDYVPDDVKKLVEIALICTQPSPSSRPTMSEIVVMLLSKSTFEWKPPARPPSTYDIKTFNSANSTSTARATATGSSNSNATTSISHFTGR